PGQFTLPELEALHQRFDGQGGFSVAGIAIDSGMGGGVRARRFAKRLGVTYPIYHDFGADSARAAFAVRTVPQMFLVDGDGAVLRHWVGEPDFSEVVAEVEKAVGAGAAAATEAAADDAAAGGR
ncbi:MAG: TlpA disulfide reductase family protein, partial [Acidobacteriota bacterium]